MRAQSQPQTHLSTTKSDPMKRQATEVLMKRLKRRGVPEEDWSYYLKSPHTWNYNIKSKSGLYKGIEVVLLTPTASKPLWIDKSSVDEFVQLRERLQKVVSIKKGIKIFKEEKDPDDNWFEFSLKRATKRADSLQQDLHTACTEIYMCRIYSHERQQLFWRRFSN